MEPESWILFFGRIHTLMVHLPIGFLFIAFFFKLYKLYKPALQLNAAISITLLLGGIAAGTACLMGYALSLEGGYDNDLLAMHMWWGIATSALAFAAFGINGGRLIRSGSVNKGLNWLILLLLVCSVSVTGHFGGSLTHGPDYLTAYFAPNQAADTIPPPNSIDEVRVFSHLIKPILDKKCVTCHRQGKQKGKLSLETIQAMKKGGEDGAVIVPGSAADSEIIRRTHLDPDDDDFMPAEGKKPLTQHEKEILVWWIDNAHASFDTLFAEIPHDGKMDGLVSSLLGLASINSRLKLPPVDSLVLAELRVSGLMIREVVGGTNLLDVTIRSSKIEPVHLDELLKRLEKIGTNIVWLNLSGTGLRDEHLQTVGKFMNLEKLRIDKNPITDNGIGALRNLHELTSINLYSTQITDKALDALKDLKKLRHVYTFNTKVSQTL